MQWGGNKSKCRPLSQKLGWEQREEHRALSIEELVFLFFKRQKSLDSIEWQKKPADREELKTQDKEQIHEGARSHNHCYWASLPGCLIPSQPPQVYECTLISPLQSDLFNSFVSVNGITMLPVAWVRSLALLLDSSLYTHSQCHFNTSQNCQLLSITITLVQDIIISYVYYYKKVLNWPHCISFAFLWFVFKVRIRLSKCNHVIYSSA